MILLASVFVFLLLLGVQGVALNLLPHARYMRWSSLIQTAAFFAVLTLYFLTPPLAHPHALAAPGKPAVVCAGSVLLVLRPVSGSDRIDERGDWPRWRGGRWPALRWWQRCCRRRSTYSLAYAAADAAHGGAVRHRPARAAPCAPGPLLARLLARRAPERAILVFIGRTLARSRQHRLLLAVYAGMGLAYVFSQAAYVLYRSRATDYGALEGRAQTALGIPLILLFFLIVGLRVSFSIPMEVRANWLFRLTDPIAGGAYLSASRKTLLLLALAPVVAIAAPVYMAVWPWPRALGHAAFLAAFGLLMIELALTGFAKVPFTCSYLPGKANLKIMFGVYWGAAYHRVGGSDRRRTSGR